MLKHLRDDREIFVIEVLSVDLKEESSISGQEVPDGGNNTQESEISSSSSNPAPSSGGGAGDCVVPDGGGGDVVVSSSTDAASGSAAVLEYQSCVICMEELPPDQVRLTLRAYILFMRI